MQENKVAAALGPENQEPMTLAEYKKAMGQFFTVRRPRIAECGHRYNHEAEPTHKNCEYCWFAFFNNHGELVQTVDEMFQKHGPETIDRMRGVKFRKMFLRFMSTVAKFVEEESKKPCEKEGHKGFRFKCEECVKEASEAQSNQESN